MKPGSREALLIAVAKARKWIKGIATAPAGLTVTALARALPWSRTNPASSSIL
jgi:hypothetical protein